MLLSVYYLGQNITFITQSSPFWWSGIAANFSVFCLTGGVIGFFFLPKDAKFIGWILIILGIVFVFISSRAILQPTSLWQFLFPLFLLLQVLNYLLLEDLDFKIKNS